MCANFFSQHYQFLEAAEAFTEALDFIESHAAHVDSTNATKSSLLRQQITLLNNRSAMYEKGNMLELALEDCNRILELEMTHTKARTRKLRILESLQRYPEALQEVCATQLLFMQANRTNLRMGLPVPPPPVPQQKMEDLLNQILPVETEKYVTKLNAGDRKNKKQLPGYYTILQLLKSYTGYNAWMAQAAKDGSVNALTDELQQADAGMSPADRAVVLLKRGRRHVYDRQYEEATSDFEQAYSLVDVSDDPVTAMGDDNYARLLEWTGMVRHWHYDLESALQCLQRCAELEPDNLLILVKQAGVQLDAGRQDESLALFERALEIDPQSVDALLHRSNLRIMQGKPELAKTDLETCIKLRPNHVMARLRLASILLPMENIDGAKRQLRVAEETEPNSSDVHSYRGELYFALGEMDDARRAFEKAIELEPSNPTPYVNAAMAILNSPPATAGQMPDTAKVIALLERAIEVDAQFTAAYIHLGQLKLGTATDLDSARKVIDLYDRGLENCRSPEEIKELCSMRVLAVAQVDAATVLKMETFNVQ